MPVQQFSQQLQGKIAGDTFIVTDALRLPVEGTETRVNASAEADEYIVSYLQSSRDNGQLENAVGWYHSHPGYGCWLSGIYQRLSMPWPAVDARTGSSKQSRTWTVTNSA